MKIKERIAALRAEMEKREIDIYVVPTADFHESEYVGDYFKAREYLTGFTGSAGTAVFTRGEAGLWTDGRYFIQAQAQLAGSGVTLYRMGEEGVPTVMKYVEDMLKQGGTIGFDGRVVNTKDAMAFQEIADKKNGKLYTAEDLAGMIWEDRPPLPANPVWVLPMEYAGESVADKLARVRKAMEEKKAGLHVLASLYDIAWLLNIRGSDIECVPVVLSFLALTKTDCMLYINEQALEEKTKVYLKESHITLKPYDAIYSDIEAVRDETVMLCKGQVNYRITESFDESVTLLDTPNPTELMKAVKNETELANTVKAHIKDGVAVTKFIYWLKNNIGKIKITEISAADYLEEKRKEQEHFLGLSFETICAYGANGAMMHYKAEPGHQAVLDKKGFLLVDSGGHYLEGTTDITRTIALGALTQEEKLHFTAVCRSCLNLAAAKFLYGVNGQNLDILARGPLWDLGIDYRCGTGHGVGHILNVHEGPNGFRWKTVVERLDSGVLEAGMVTTDEPGVYIEGEYGIRTENELVCRKAGKNEYGQFMEFETITYAPIDLDAILADEMDERERMLLNDYHRLVYEKISPYLDNEEKAWLKESTREI